jgi:hypothetical protein
MLHDPYRQPEVLHVPDAQADVRAAFGRPDARADTCADVHTAADSSDTNGNTYADGRFGRGRCARRDRFRFR